MLIVAVPEAPLAIVKLGGVISASALSVDAVAVKFTVPAYPPVEVTVIVEVPVEPADVDAIVMLGIVIAKPGLVTVTVAFPEEEP